MSGTDEFHGIDLDRINTRLEGLLNLVPAAVYFSGAANQRPTTTAQDKVVKGKYIHKKAGTKTVDHKLKRTNQEKCQEQTIVAIQTEAASSLPPAALKEKLQERINLLATKRTRDSSKPEKRIRKGAAKKVKVVAEKKVKKDLTAAEETAPAAAVVAPAVDDLQFGNIDFTTADEKALDAPIVVKKATKRGQLESSLRKAEKLEAALSEMDPVDKFKTQHAISTKLALLKAQGAKVKNDPKLLKKSLKLQETKKKQSAKKWASRKQTDAKKKRAAASEIRSSME